MSFIYKNNIGINIFGASHSEVMGITLEGIKPGFVIDVEEIKRDIIRRKPQKNVGTSRVEADEFEFASGLFNGFTTGDNITILVKNKNIISKHYKWQLPRPSHSDFVSFHKSQGYFDYRGGGKFSGRLTVLFVIVGNICKQILQKEFQIEVFSQIKNIGHIFDNEIVDFKTLDILNLQTQPAPCININKQIQMWELINEMRIQKDSIGGSINCYASNIPIGVGSPYFNSFESVFSHLMYSIGAVKAVSFGLGEDFSKLRGSECADEMYYDENSQLKYYANNNGGISGGMSNGNILKSNIVFKPTPSIFQPLRTINVENKTNTTLELVGRHDPCIAFRAAVICESIMALTIMDLINE